MGNNWKKESKNKSYKEEQIFWSIFMTLTEYFLLTFCLPPIRWQFHIGKSGGEI